MLGDVLGEERGKIIGRRVLPSAGGTPKVEVSFQTTSKVLGIDARNFGTYWSEMRADGFLYGEGQGILMTTGGDSAAWVGQGIGKIRSDGGVSWRGAVYYQTTAPKLSRLNGIACVFEYEADAGDNAQSKIWEWK